MTIPNTLRQFLEQHKVKYSVITHPYTGSTMESAEAAHISGEQVAKGVLLKDNAGFVLAVLPATHTLRVGAIQELLDRPMELASEDDLAGVFPDCAVGAVPALGPAYRLETVVDEAITEAPEVYFEAGDHEELLKITEPKFEALLAGARFMSFSSHRP